MAEVQLTAGTLPPPACYATEQERFDAYVAAITATVTGGIQWWVSATAPPSLDYFWLRLDSIGNPIEALKWSTSDGIWLRWFSGMIFGDDTGAADNAFAMTPLPAFTAPMAYREGMTYTFIAAHNSTGISTFNVNALGVKTIKKNLTEDLTLNDIQVGQVVTLTFDGVNFQITSRTSQVAAHGSLLVVTPGTATFTVPANVTSIEVECVGGGGGGSCVGTPNGNGGGGGGYCYKRWTVAPAGAIIYTVGAKGLGSTIAGTADDTSGSPTTFNTTAATPQVGSGGTKGSGGGTGGVFSGGDWGFNGGNGKRCTVDTTKFAGGQSAFPASMGGWRTEGGAQNGVYGGGGAGDNDTSGLESSNGGDGLILIKW